MKGVINKGIQELVESRFGGEAWLKVKELADCNEPFFAVSEDYPDEMTVALVGAVAQVADLDPETVMIEFGKYWVAEVGARCYPSFYKLAGSTPREFLLSMTRVHDQVTCYLEAATPPRFTYEELPSGQLLMHYHSQRGLCAVLHGLILGVGIHFGQELQVRETACMKKGDPHCTMEVTFP